MVAPGLAGFDTIMRLHNAKMIGHPEARWGVTVGNPIHDAIREIADHTGVDFALDVTINRDHGITSVYAGELSAVHRVACRFARQSRCSPWTPFRRRSYYEQWIPTRPESVPGSKGNFSRRSSIKPGGTIIAAVECLDGIPDHGEYGRLLKSSSGPRDILESVHSPWHNVHDQWQVQISSTDSAQADVKIKSTYLTDDKSAMHTWNP